MIYNNRCLTTVVPLFQNYLPISLLALSYSFFIYSHIFFKFVLMAHWSVPPLSCFILFPYPVSLFLIRAELSSVRCPLPFLFCFYFSELSPTCPLVRTSLILFFFKPSFYLSIGPYHLCSRIIPVLIYFFIGPYRLCF